MDLLRLVDENVKTLDYIAKIIKEECDNLEGIEIMRIATIITIRDAINGVL